MNAEYFCLYRYPILTTPYVTKVSEGTFLALLHPELLVAEVLPPLVWPHALQEEDRRGKAVPAVALLQGAFVQPPGKNKKVFLHLVRKVVSDGLPSQPEVLILALPEGNGLVIDAGNFAGSLQRPPLPEGH